MADKEIRKVAHQCVICGILCGSFVALCGHVVGRKHRENVQRSCPDSLPHMYKLQYFFDTHMQQAPLVGLECMEENQEKTGYKYKCLLCGFQGKRHTAFQHITGYHHIKEYILKHHPELSVHAAMYCQKPEYLDAVQRAAAKVCNIYGRKKIKEIPPTAKCPIQKNIEQHDPVQERGVVHDQNRDLHDKPLCLESKEDQCGFSGNADFLAYLQTFEIQDDEDARIMKQITVNCTQALVRYWHDQAQLNEPPGKASETVSGPAQLFFNSIKNMEESEVVETLNKIAATNPVFSGNVIPNVIQYLRETGRFKAA